MPDCRWWICGYRQELAIGQGLPNLLQEPEKIFIPGGAGFNVDMDTGKDEDAAAIALPRNTQTRGANSHPPVEPVYQAPLQSRAAPEIRRTH